MSSLCVIYIYIYIPPHGTYQFVISFYPITKAITFFFKNLEKEKKETIEDCLRMLKFGMGNTLLSFAGKCYNYGGSNDFNEWGLTIGGCESA